MSGCCQFITNIVRRTTEEFAHALPVNLTLLVANDTESIKWSIRRFYPHCGENGSLVEDVSFGYFASVCIDPFQTQYQTTVRVILKRANVCFVVKVAKLLNEGIVLTIKLFLQPRQLFIGTRSVLLGNQVERTLSQRHHVDHALPFLTRRLYFHKCLGGIERPLLCTVQLPIFNDKGANLCTVSSQYGLFCCFLELLSLGRSLGHNAFRERGCKFLHRFRQVSSIAFHAGFLFRHLPKATACPHDPQHHLRVNSEILVQVNLLFPTVAMWNIDLNRIRPLANEPPFCVSWVKGLKRRIGWIVLLKNENVRGHASSGVTGKGIVRQSNCRHKVRLIFQVLPECLVRGGVHRVMRGDECHQTPRTNLVDGLGKEVVMNLFCQPPAVGPIEFSIVNGEVPKRHIGNGEVEVVVGECCFLKPLNLHVRCRVQPFSNLPGEWLQFYPGPAGSVARCGRLKTEEAPMPHCRLKDTPAGEPKSMNHVPHRSDNGRGGKVCVERGFIGSLEVIF